jgi:hypothetical protein
MFANLVGFDDGLWPYVRKMGDDVCQRLIRLVLRGVDSSMNHPSRWPCAPFDCRYLARVCGRIGNSRELICRALGGEWDGGQLAAPAVGIENLLRLGEACRSAESIQGCTAKALVKHALRLCVDDATSGADRPVGRFDTVYLAKMVERAFSTAPGNIRLILAGEGWKLDWE